MCLFFPGSTYFLEGQAHQHNVEEEAYNGRVKVSIKFAVNGGKVNNIEVKNVQVDEAEVDDVKVNNVEVHYVEVNDIKVGETSCPLMIHLSLNVLILDPFTAWKVTPGTYGNGVQDCDWPFSLSVLFHF